MHNGDGYCRSASLESLALQLRCRACSCFLDGAGDPSFVYCWRCGEALVREESFASRGVALVRRGFRLVLFTHGRQVGRMQLAARAVFQARGGAARGGWTTLRGVGSGGAWQGSSCTICRMLADEVQMWARVGHLLVCQAWNVLQTPTARDEVHCLHGLGKHRRVTTSSIPLAKSAQYVQAICKP